MVTLFKAHAHNGMEDGAERLTYIVASLQAAQAHVKANNSTQSSILQYFLLAN